MDRRATLFFPPAVLLTTLIFAAAAGGSPCSTRRAFSPTTARPCPSATCAARRARRSPRTRRSIATRRRGPARDAGHGGRYPRAYGDDPQPQFAFGKLLLATGATPRRLAVPGADLPGVYALRTLQDSDAIRAAAGTAERAVVVGGGFIGMEVAGSLRQLGLTVTLIHLGRGLFDQVGSYELSDQLLALYREHGVQVRLDEEVIRFAGRNALDYVATKSGLRVEADIAVVGIGVVPNVDFLDGSGIDVDNGVVVDERFATTAPGVHAAGDVANFFDPLYGRSRRIEHWSNANYQGTEVGAVLAGHGAGYDTVSSFFSEVFGTTIKVFGDTGDADQSAAEGSLESGFFASYGQGGRLVGAISVNQSQETEARLKDLIADRAPADALAVDLAGARS